MPTWSGGACCWQPYMANNEEVVWLMVAAGLWLPWRRGNAKRGHDVLHQENFLHPSTSPLHHSCSPSLHRTPTQKLNSVSPLLIPDGSPAPRPPPPHGAIRWLVPVNNPPTLVMPQFRICNIHCLPSNQKHYFLVVSPPFPTAGRPQKWHFYNIKLTMTQHYQSHILTEFGVLV